MLLQLFLLLLLWVEMLFTMITLKLEREVTFLWWFLACRSCTQGIFCVRVQFHGVMTYVHEVSCAISMKMTEVHESFKENANTIVGN